MCKKNLLKLTAKITLISFLFSIIATNFYKVELLAQSSKIKLALLPILDESGGEIKDISTKSTDALYLVLGQADYFELSAKEAGSGEVTKNNLKDYTNLAALSLIGKSLGVDYLMMGSIKSISMDRQEGTAKIRVALELFDVNAGAKIMRIDEEKMVLGKPGYTGSLENLIDEALNNVFNSSVNDFIKRFMVSGMVLVALEDKILVDLGSQQGIKEGSELAVWRTKKGSPAQIIAKLTVKKSLQRDSNSVIDYIKPGVIIQTGDKVTIIYNPSKLEIAKKKKSLSSYKKYAPIIIGGAVIAAIAFFAGKKKKQEPTSTIINAKVSNITVQPSRDADGNPVMIIDWGKSTDPSVTGYYVYRAEGNETGPTGGYTLIHDTQGEAGVPPWSDADTAPKSKTEAGNTTPKYQSASCTDGTYLMCGNYYYYQVQAHDSQGKGGPVSTTTKAASGLAGDIPAPKAPTLTSATAGGSKVTLTWTAPTQRIDSSTLDATEIDSYYVYVSSNGGSTYGLCSGCSFIPKDTTTFAVTGLTNGTAYNFKVKVLDTDGKSSDFSNAKGATPRPSPAPAKVSWDSSAPTAAGDTQVTLKWNAVTTRADGSTIESPLEEITGYNIYYNTSYSNLLTQTAPNSFVPNSNNATISTIITSLTNGTAYYFQITAVNNEGTESTRSDAQNATPQSCTGGNCGNPTTVNPAPQMPTGVTATPGNQKVVLSWTPPADSDLAGYYVYRSTAFVPLSGYTKVSGTTAFMGVQFIDIGLTNNTTYYYYVVAVDTANQVSSNSNVVTVVPQPPIPPAAPLWATSNAVVPGATTITLNWLNVTSDINGAGLTEPVAKYRIYRSVGTDYSTGANGDFTQVGEVNTPILTYTDTGLTAGNWYFYKLSAVLTDGTEGQKSGFRYSQIALPTLNLVAPDKGATISPIETTWVADAATCGQIPKYTYKEGNITFAWTPVVGASRYIVEVADDSNFTTLESNVTVSASGFLEGETPNTILTWIYYSCGFVEAVYNKWWRVKAVSDTSITISTSEIRGFATATYVISGSNSWPNPPENISGIGSSGQIDFTWTAPTTNSDGTTLNAADIAGYNIYRSTTINGNFTLYTQVFGATSVSLTNWTTSGDNFFKFSTINAQGKEGPLTSNVTLVNVPGAASTSPSPPAALAVVSGDTKVDLTWTEPTTFDDGGTLDPATEVLYYVIYRWTSVTSCINAVTGSATTSQISAPSTTASDITVVNGNTYYYKIATLTKAGITGVPSSSCVAALPLSTTAPPSPINVKATTNDQYVTLNWDWNTNFVQDIKGFVVYRDGTRIPADPTAVLVPFSSSTTTYTYIDSGLTNGTSYGYQFSAINLSGQESTLTQAITAKPLTSTKPTGVVDLTGAVSYTAGVSYSDAGSVNLDWGDYATEGAGNLSGYNVYVSNDPNTFSVGFPFVFVTDSSASNIIQYCDKGTTSSCSKQNMVLGGNTYYFKVSVVRNGQEGTLSAAAQTFTYTDAPPTTPPTTPSPFTATAGNGSVVLSWTANPEDAVANPNANPGDLRGYVIGRRVLGGAFTWNLLPRQSAGITSYVDTSVTNGTTYEYQLRACRYTSGGKANWPADSQAATSTKCSSSTIVTASPSASGVPVPPDWETNGIVIQDISLILNWKTVVDIIGPPAITTAGYRIYRTDSSLSPSGTSGWVCIKGQTVGGGACTDPTTINKTTLTYEDTGASDTGLTYYYKLTTVSTQGVESLNSNVMTGRPGIAPLLLQTPGANQTLVYATSTSVPTIDFIWSTINGVNHYILEVADNPNMQTANLYLVANTNTTASYQWVSTLNLSQLPSTLYWRVTAYDAYNSIISQSTYPSGGAAGMGQPFNLSYLAP